MYNKNNIAVAKVASKSNIRPELACVAFYGDRTVATDSFRLIEMSAMGEKQEEPTLYNGNALASVVKLKKSETIDGRSIELKPVDADREYPDIDKLFERVEGKDYAEVIVNAGYLAEICNVLKELDPFGKVTLKIPTSSTHDPVIITAETSKGAPERQTARALLMPMNN